MVRLEGKEAAPGGASTPSGDLAVTQPLNAPGGIMTSLQGTRNWDPSRRYYVYRAFDQSLGVTP